MSDGQSEGNNIWKDDSMVTAFDLLGRNKPLQKHWLKRIIAYIIDLAIVTFPLYLLFLMLSVAFLGMGFSFLFFPFAGGLILVFYSAIFEVTTRQTIGKKLMDLQVESLMGGLDISEALIRNVSKVHAALVFLDTLAGMATDGDPRQRYTDRVSDTTVIASHEPVHVRRYIEEHLRGFTEAARHMGGSAESQGQQSASQNIDQIRRCRECGGELEDIGGGKSRCKECGRIQ